MTYYMGIDGGGSNLRVVVTDSDLQVVARACRLTANPSSIGRLKSVLMIQSAMREALTEADLQPAQITAAAVGVAGASVVHSRDWLIETVRDVLPTGCIVPSSDHEIALVGAHGKREGVLLLAGTGSVAFGISPQGQQVQVGGWGYLIGDEGSAYWIGREALQSATQAADGRGPETALSSAIIRILNLTTTTDLIGWLYQKQANRVRDVALLAPLVIETADNGDPVAQQIIERAAEELTRLCRAVIERLQFVDAAIAFTGGLIENPNRLSNKLLDNLGLTAFPKAAYSPVIGAALLAKLEADATT